MDISIRTNKIVKDPRNRVTSNLIYQRGSRRDLGNIKFDDDGIFSNKIFGNFNSCICGKNKEIDTVCEECGCRVIDKDNMPDFYIDLTIPVATFFADFSVFQNEDEIRSLISYNSFVYDDKIVPFTPDIDINMYENDRIHIGIDALKEMNVPDSWIDKNTTDYISISHPAFRPLIHNKLDSSPLITDINQVYMDLLSTINKFTSYNIQYFPKLFNCVKGYYITELYNKVIDKIFYELAESRNSVVKNQMQGHPISGAIRAVVINRFDIDEDIILIGDTLIETLYPYIYKQYNGDMYKINEYLINSNARVIINRPPSICHLSIIAMKPRVASVYPLGKTANTDNCVKTNIDFCEEYYSNINKDNSNINFGDAEVNNQINEYGYAIDTIGVRCVATNPVVMDGLAGDYDGDVLLVSALYSDEAKKEADLMLPSNSYMNFPNGTIRNHIIEDFFSLNGD